MHDTIDCGEYCSNTHINAVHGLPSANAGVDQLAKFGSHHYLLLALKQPIFVLRLRCDCTGIKQIWAWFPRRRRTPLLLPTSSKLLTIQYADRIALEQGIRRPVQPACCPPSGSSYTRRHTSRRGAVKRCSGNRYERWCDCQPLLCRFRLGHPRGSA